MTDPKPRADLRQRLMSVPRAVWILGWMLVAFTVPFLVRAWYLSHVPDIGDPFDVAEFCKSNDISPENDALPAYRRASTLYFGEYADHYSRSVPRVGTWQVSAPIKEAIDPVLTQGWGVAEDYVKEWVATHEPSLSEWRQATELDRIRFNPSQSLLWLYVDNGLRYLQEVDSVARLRGRQCEAENDFAGAFDWYRARLRYRENLWSGAAYYYERESMDLVRWAALPDVTLAQLRNARSQLHRDQASIKPASNAIKIEYIRAMNLLSDRDGLTTWIRYSTGNQTPMTTKDKFEASLWRTAYWVCGEPERTRRIYQHLVANQLRTIDLPAPQRRPTYFTSSTLMYLDDPAVPLPSGHLNVGRIAAAIQSSAISGLLEIGLFQNSGLDMYLQESHAFRVLLELQLALQSHHRNHGEFPAKLEDLVPDDIDAVPVDPCDPAALNIRYRRDNSGQATVWSVGNNGTDENGVRHFYTGDAALVVLAPTVPGTGASQKTSKD